MAAMGTLEQELQKIYDSEINLSISWMWDAGFDLKLGMSLAASWRKDKCGVRRIYFPGSKTQSRNAVPLPSITSRGWAERSHLSSLSRLRRVRTALIALLNSSDRIAGSHASKDI